LAEAEGKFTSPGAKIMLDFIAAAKRGVCADTGVNNGGSDDE
jgi:hypothetical protein